MREVARRDEKAFAALYDEVATVVYGIVLRVLRDRAQAEEVTQEVLFELWRLAPHYNPARGSVRGFAATVAHRRAVDRVRFEEASRARDDRFARLHLVEQDSAASEVEDPIQRERVTKALSELSDLQRQTITLVYYEGYTYRQVAGLLEVPENTIKTRVRDGLIRLRQIIGARDVG